VNVAVNGVPGTVSSRTDAFVARFNSNGTQLTYGDGNDRRRDDQRVVHHHDVDGGGKHGGDLDGD
jgi:hypothetical protein